MMLTRSVRRVRLAALLGLLACSRGPELLEVPLPDLAPMDPPVQRQARERHTALQTRLSARAPASDLAAAFGDLGMLLHAAAQYDAAEPAYRNARTLQPSDPRWSYYLGHLYRSRGDVEQGVAAFEQALALEPADVATLVWLGRLHLDRGDAAAAEPLFARAQAAAPRTVAALVGLGQSALARRDYQRAAARLEEALAIAPDAASVYAPLAQAYRGLGDTARADAQMARWRNVDVAVPDPRMDRLRESLESALAYEQRGSRAVDAGRFADAAALFRTGLGLTAAESPVGRSLRHRLALALYMSGDLASALREFDESIRLAPPAGPDEPAARAHYGLAIIQASAGHDAAAIDHLERAVAYDPSYGQAHLALADLLRRQSRVQDSLPHYREAARINPQQAAARFGEAIGLVRLRRFGDARDALEDAVRAFPGRPEFQHALARVLAAAPDAAVRDGARAHQLVATLFETDKRTEVGETIAMALAETGQFDEAAAIQRGVMDAAGRAGLDDAVRRMSINLRRYEQRLPCRMPWADDEAVHRPGPPVSPELARRLAELGRAAVGAPRPPAASD